MLRIIGNSYNNKIRNVDPQQGDVVREKKYAQPLEVVRIDPPSREAEVVPQGKPTAPKRWLPFEELQPYKKEG